MTVKGVAEAKTEFSSLTEAVASARALIKNTRTMASQIDNGEAVLSSIRTLEELIGYYEVDPGSVSVTEVRAEIQRISGRV